MNEQELLKQLSQIHSLLYPKITTTEFTDIGCALNHIRTGIVYNMFDIEATRRELVAAKKGK